MKYLFNGLIIIFSVYIVNIIFKGEQSTFIYFALFFIEWFAIMLFRPELRKLTFSRFYKKGQFGSEDTAYGLIHSNSIEEDLQKVDPFAFEELVADLFEARGYEVEVTPAEKDFGADVIARKGQDIIAIQVKHRMGAAWKVSNDAVQQVVASMSIYKANKSMVVTNGRFTNHAIKQATSNQTELINGNKLVEMIREVIYKQQEETSKVYKMPSNSSQEDHATKQEVIQLELLIDEAGNSIGEVLKSTEK